MWDSTSPGPRTWTKAGPAGCSSSGSSRRRRCTTPTIKAGKLRQRFDAIVLADQQPRSILEGNASRGVRPEYRGGIGDEGLEALKAFVAEGGTLVLLGNAARPGDPEVADPGAQPQERPDARPALRAGHDRPRAGGRRKPARLRPAGRHVRLLQQQPVLRRRGRLRVAAGRRSSRAIRTPTSWRRAG